MKRIVLFCGKAGSGKDTAASMVANAFPGQVRRMAFADPMKELARAVFLFSNDQLWGPSEKRNAPDPRLLDRRFFNECRDRFWTVGGSFLTEWLQALASNGLPLSALGTNRPEITRRFLEWFEAWEPGEDFNGTPRAWKARGLDVQRSPRGILQTLGTDFGRGVHPDIWVCVAMRRVRDHEDQIYTFSDCRFTNEIERARESGLRYGFPVAAVLVNSITSSIHSTHESERSLPEQGAGVYDSVIFNDKARGFEQLREQVNATLFSLGWRDDDSSSE